MKNSLLWVGLLVVLLGVAAFFHFRQQREAAPVAVTVPEAEPVAAIRHPVPETAETGEEPLPALDESDAALRERLAAAVGNRDALGVLLFDRLIRRIVVTVDNLDREQLPQKYLPLRSPQGNFLVRGGNGTFTLDPANHRRYAPYVQLAEAADTRLLVGVYHRFYPLFQQAYEDLGYPGRYFNDRLIEVLDHLLATPEPAEPVRLVQPKIAYAYADPELEKLSAGQKVLLRIGPENRARTKQKLADLRRQLTAPAED